MDMDMDMNDHGESDSTNGDGEGVWSADIEQCFREALLLFPPCGRRKAILQEEGGGKMYGRNELIARHIMMRTGKSRTRKQVSSHIQVLARRKAKAEAASSSSAGVSPSPSGIAAAARPQSHQSSNENHRHSSIINQQGPGDQQLSRHQHQHQQQQPQPQHHHHHQQQQPSNPFYDIWIDRAIATQKIRLVEFSAFIEYRNFQQTSGGISSGSLISHQPSSSTTSSTTSTAAAAGTTTITMSANPAVLTGDTGLPADNHQDLSLGQQQLQAYQPQTQQQSQPLSSNHHLPAQFNQANPTGYNNNGQLQHNNQQIPQHQHQSHNMITQQGAHCMATMNSHQFQAQQQPHQLSAGFTRHSYVKIDYRLGAGAGGGHNRGSRHQVNQLEKIAISQIQDKFPEIGGSEGLFQRGPSDAFYLIKFWADLNNDYEYNIEDQNSYFGFSSHFETVDAYRDITCSTKACSYGCQVVEKVEKIYSAFNNLNGHYSYEISRSPMCEFMVQFIKKLRELPRASQMNSVLENFTVLQVITRESTPEILLCLAYVFEVASPAQNNGPQYHIYKLTRD